MKLKSFIRIAIIIMVTTCICFFVFNQKKIIDTVDKRDPVEPITYIKPVQGSTVVTILDLLNDRSDKELIGLKHTMDAFGIPYKVTSNIDYAIKTKEMLFVAGRIEEVKLNKNKLLKNLMNWKESGTSRTLWISGVHDNKFLLDNLGLTFIETSQKNSKLIINSNGPICKYLDAAEEKEVFLPGSDTSKYIKTRSYDTANVRAPWTAETIATVDGKPSVVLLERNDTNSRVVISGISFLDVLFSINYQKIAYDKNMRNQFAPFSDVMKLIIRAGYEKWTSKPFIRQFTPYKDKKAVVIITHDIDAASAFKNLRDDFAPIEQSKKIKSTLFVTTNYNDNKYISDFYSNKKNRDLINELSLQGFDVQAHSVSHLPDMANWESGPQIFNLNEYKPKFNSDTGKTLGGQVNAELLISAGLLENYTNSKVRGWRSGYLIMPKFLGNLLSQSGYYYSSNVCSYNVGGSFPYLTLKNLGWKQKSIEVPVLEIPISMSDVAIKDQEQTLLKWIDITKKNANNNAPSVLLVHPTKPQLKLDVFKKYINHITSDDNLWIATMDEWYSWYRETGICSEQK